MQLADIEERYFRDPTEALSLCQSALVLAPDMSAAQHCVGRNRQALSNGRR